MSSLRHPGGALDLARLRERLASTTGPRYWKSLEELAETDEVREMLHREFPEQASELLDPASRRDFLKLMGASLALAGIGACTQRPEESIVPYVQAPEQIVPGKPLHFASAVSLGGLAAGVLVESHMGRPTKIEGNPDHPASLGATDSFAQASVLSLYDPDRSQTLTHLGEIATWSQFLEALRILKEGQSLLPGGGVRILTETVTSPTLARQIREVLAAMPGAKWHQYEPVHRDHARRGAAMVFGEPLDPIHRFDRADVVLSLGSDFLGSGPGSVRHVRDFAGRRRAKDHPSRLYAIESTPTLTGAKADHRLPLSPGGIEDFARALAARLGVPVAAGASSSGKAFLDAVARDLEAHRGSSLVVAGETESPTVVALAHAMNHALGNLGRTVVLVDPPDAAPVEHGASIRDLARDMDAGRVSFLLVLGGNPVYDAPADLRFGEVLQKVAMRAHLSLYNDETSVLCQWHLPQAHALECWSDTRAHDGTASIVQPLVAPLYGGKSAHDVLAALAGKSQASAYETVRDTWRPRAGAADFERFWRRAVHDGVLPETALPERSVAPVRGWEGALPPARSEGEGLHVLFRPDPTVFDGRFANNGWLQELPKPLTKLTWDNAALVSPALAERLSLSNGDVVEVEAEGSRVEAPVWILPGQAESCVTVHLGYGRTRAGRVGSGAGFDAYRLRTSERPWSVAGASLRKTGRRRTLACVQDHHSMEGREPVHVVRLGEHGAHDGEDHRGEGAGHGGHGELPTMYPAHPYPGHAWGMSIDLDSCVGCGACVVACQAENNIPIVGRDQVAVGREMHWLRIDRYFEGSLDNPETYHQPLPCMHCENAPCEVVCPVAATAHSSEGLNDMVYNRCVGTRYCSNNCPYKVRRFNFLQYADFETESLKLLRNPDVTVRSRGVMEKCTYCVQRINEARITAQREDREIRDGEIVTACQQACAAQAIVFGDVNDPESRVSRLKRDGRDYSLLEELNTRPRTTYLAAVRNPSGGLDGGTE
jgi:molybdopterin-containing oxidoreductase family iron-sulfur binding subunit